MLAAIRRGSSLARVARSTINLSARSSRTGLDRSTYTFRATPVARSISTTPKSQNASYGAAQAVQEQQHENVESQEQSSPASTGEQASNSGRITRFDELLQRNLVHPSIVRALTEDMKLETMTDVQSLTINESLKGVDT